MIVKKMVVGRMREIEWRGLLEGNYQSQIVLMMRPARVFRGIFTELWAQSSTDIVYARNALSKAEWLTNNAVEELHDGEEDLLVHRRRGDD